MSSVFNPTGEQTVGFGPQPGQYFGRREPTTMRGLADEADGPTADRRVRWARSMASALRSERQPITQQMRRSMELYRGKHWSSQRAPWKAASKINYCAWVPEQWAATLADNKPSASFSALDEVDAWKADILTAAWEDFYEAADVQQHIENVIKLSRIVKKALLRFTYDPNARGGKGGLTLTPVSGTQVYANRDATTLDDVTLMMYEYIEPKGSLAARYPHLTGIGSLQERGNLDLDSASQMAPRQNSYTTQGGVHQAPYVGPTAPEANGTSGFLVREFWSFPKGPDARCEVEELVWTASNEPATTPRLIEYTDGTQEPLEYTVWDGLVMYEFPMSVNEVLRALEPYGGPHILTFPSVEAKTEHNEVLLYPNGRQLVVVGDEIACDQCNPFWHGQVPFIEFDAIPDPTQFFGMSDIDLIGDMQEYLNRLYSLLLDAAILTANPVWVLPDNTKTDDEEITNAPGAIIRVDPMFFRANAGRRQGPEMPQYVQMLLQFTIGQIREISGLNEVATGGKFKGQQAAETVSMYQEAAGIRFRQAIRSIERAVKRLGYQFAHNVAQFYDQPTLVKLQRASGAEKTATFIGAMIADTELKFRIKASSMLPQSPSARFSQIMQAIQLPFPTYDMAEIYSSMEEFGVIRSADHMNDRLERLAKSMQAPGELWKWPMYWMQQGAPKKPAGRPKNPRNARGTGKPK